MSSLLAKQNPLIEKATTNNENPTPGYLYNQICEQSKRDAETCERILNSLMQKLRHQSPAVKLKVLLVIKHLLQRGNPHFQISLQRISEELRPCLNFRGVPDPLHGDAPYRLVRENAQLVMNLTFETRLLSEEVVMDSVSSNQFGQSNQRNMSGNRTGRPGFSRGSNTGNNFSGGSMSNNSFSGGSNIGFSSGNTGFTGNRGFGNNNTYSNNGNFQGNTVKQPYGESIQNNVGLSRKKNKNILESFIESAQNGFGLDSNKNSNLGLGFTTNNQSNYGAPNGFSGGYIPSHHNSNANPQPSNRHTIQSIEHIERLESEDINAHWVGEPEESSNSFEDDILNSEEAKMLVKLTAPSGVRLIPSRTQILKFLENVTVMRVEIICDILSYLLGNNEWKTQLKAAHLILVLIEEENINVIQYFLSGEQIDHLADVMSQSTRNSTTEKIGSLLSALHPYKELLSTEEQFVDTAGIEDEYDTYYLNQNEKSLYEKVENVPEDQGLFTDENSGSLFSDMETETPLFDNAEDQDSSGLFSSMDTGNPEDSMFSTMETTEE